MPTPTLKSFDEMSENWHIHKKDMEGRPYAGDSVLDYWLSVIRERDAEYRRSIEGLKTSDDNEKCEFCRNTLLRQEDPRMCIIHIKSKFNNQALDQALSIIPGKDE